MTETISILVAANRAAWELLGSRGIAEIDAGAAPTHRCRVGRIRDDSTMEIIGRGRTFRIAIDEAKCALGEIVGD